MGAMQEIDTTKQKAFQGNHATQKKRQKTTNKCERLHK
jgi:hypothetical protein